MYAKLVRKKCSTCKDDKPLSKFYARKASPDGLAYICRDCEDIRHEKYRAANGGHLSEKQKAWRRANRERIIRQKRKYAFGISEDEQEVLLKKQNHSCAICLAPAASLRIGLAVDHCHDSGTVRGFLCNNCNRGIGLLQDKVELLLSAAEYLLKHKRQR